MNRFERLLRIDRLMRRGAPVPMRVLVEELEVSRSSITRDLAYLRDYLGAPVVYDAEANGHRYDPDAEAFELPGMWLNQSELYALLATEQLLESAQPGLLSPYIGPLKARVRRLLEYSGQDASEVSERVRLIDSGRRSFDSDAFAAVADAVIARRRLEFEYRGRARNDRRQRSVHPQRLLHYRSNWYVVAWCDDAQALRMFSVDRMAAAQPVAGVVRAVPAQDLDRWVGASYGIFTGTASAWAQLRFNPDSARWAAEERWHPDQIGSWTGDGYELQVPYADPTELIMEVLRYGADVEVLDPPQLRAEVVRRLQRALENY